MAAFEVVALDTATPQLRAPGSGDTYSLPRQAEIAYVAAGANAAQLIFAPTSGSKMGLSIESGGSAVKFIDVTSNSSSLVFRTNSADFGSNGSVKWTNASNNPLTTLDLKIGRVGTKCLRLDSNSTTDGAAMEFHEMTAPAAGAANTVRIYAQDNGAGKTQLMALFNTGAAQQIAIEP